MPLGGRSDHDHARPRRSTSLTDSTAKRAMDVAVALAALVVLSPLLAGVAAAVFATMGRPILFRQERPGRDANPFVIVKFRTMRVPRKGDIAAATDAVRLTPLGARLRRYSLDELPELWNVLRGDMSLVGPRPLLTAYLPYYTDLERRRFAVRPGITGWAQVRGRNHARWDDRLADDVWYVDHWGLWLDVRILLRTVRQIVRGQDVVADARSIMLNLDEERRVGASSMDASS